MMKYLGWWFFLFLFFEIISIFWMVDAIGGLSTLLLIVIFFILGTVMLRYIGLSAIFLAGSAIMSRKKMSFYQALWPIRYGISAILFMSPGFISNIIALILLLPIKGPRNIKNKDNFQSTSYTKNRYDDDIIDGDFSEVKPRDYRHIEDKHKN